MELVRMAGKLRKRLGEAEMRGRGHKQKSLPGGRLWEILLKSEVTYQDNSLEQDKSFPEAVQIILPLFLSFTKDI